MAGIGPVSGPLLTEPTCGQPGNDGRDDKLRVRGSPATLVGAFPITSPSHRRVSRAQRPGRSLHYAHWRRFSGADVSVPYQHSRYALLATEEFGRLNELSNLPPC